MRKVSNLFALAILGAAISVVVFFVERRLKKALRLPKKTGEA